MSRDKPSSFFVYYSMRIRTVLRVNHVDGNGIINNCKDISHCFSYKITKIKKDCRLSSPFSMI
jgi:hypothetical protein